ncbi:MAG: exodeoxyribonuclease VII small subunit [Ruminococcaceae bacterium]|nr:exodeoxyribonuclease VII small subunit [Oscillospiraceae bacterium]
MQDMNFEQAMERLEQITVELSSEGITLEKSLALYEEGVALARACNQRLEDTERKIKILQISADGEIEENDFPQNN